MSEEKKKNFDEQTLARVLEAAWVLQEHQHELEELKSSLDLRRNGSNGINAAATRTVTASSPIALPHATASSIAIPSPSASPSPAGSAPVASPATVSSSLIASAAPPASSPVPVFQADEEMDYNSILAQVMETQHQVQVRRLDLDASMSLVTEQVIDVCGAAGAAIGIVNRRTVGYRSVAGIRTLPAGSEVPVDQALCAQCLQSGEVWQCADTNSDNVRQREQCRHRGIGSLIAAPLFHEGRSVGALELLFSDPRAFSEQDVQTCQLMAGILTEALSRDLRWKDAPPATPPLITEATPAQEAAKPKTAPEATESYQCYRCGNSLLAGEQFCGECGTPRSGDYEPPNIQSKVASLWHMQEGNKTEPSAHVQLDELPAEPTEDAVPMQMQMRTSIVKPPDRPRRTGVPHFGLNHSDLRDAETDNGADSLQAATIDSPDAKSITEEEDAPASRTNKALEELISPPPPPVRADWSSATSARDFLEQVADVNQNVLLRFWNTRRGDIYLAIAVILVACVIRWGMWSNHPESPRPSPTPASASSPSQAPVSGAPQAPVASAPQKTTQPDLTLSERMLIALGLADAPEPPIDKGNPSTQVWVDLHTALYYCPGADLYGKTAGGKYTTQREAELDQFQPAYRKTCN